MDYEPRSGPSPAEAVQQQITSWARVWPRGAVVIVKQSIEQISPVASRVLDTMKPPVALGSPPRAQAPYGEDFTASGMCNWAEYIAPFRTGGFDSGMMLDESWLAAEHLHKCRACRDRVGGVIQDVEGELGAHLRYDNRDDDAE